MKKVLALLMLAVMFSLVACGPTEEEKAKAEADAAAMVEEIKKVFIPLNNGFYHELSSFQSISFNLSMPCFFKAEMKI